MKRQKNKPVGDVPCPFRNCNEVHPVYQFAARNASRDRQRFAGRFYGYCTANGGKFEAQEHILENIQWRDEKDRPSDRSNENASQPENPEKVAPAPVQNPSPPVPASPAKPVPDRSAPLPFWKRFPTVLDLE